MKFAALLLAGSALASLSGGVALAAPTPQNGVCPGIGTISGTSNCNTEIFFSAGGTITTITPHNGSPYDGSDDNLVGIINNSGSTIHSLTFMSTTANLFGFDGDGLQTYGASLGSDPTGYGGKTSSGQFTTFTAYSGGTGTVVFGSNGIANGGTAYFSLEAPPSINLMPLPPNPGVPEPVSLALLGTGLAGLGVLRHGRKAR